jgi:hypothetical protein
MRFTIAGLTALCLAAGLPAPPPTRVDIVIDRMHGAEIADPYRWLEDQQSPEIRSWIAKQNEYSRAVFDAVPGRDRLRGHLESFFAGEAARAPYARGDRYFYTRRTGDRDRVSIVTRKGVDGPERTLVDPATLTSDPDTTVSVMDVSPDGQLLAYATRKGGEVSGRCRSSSRTPVVCFPIVCRAAHTKTPLSLPITGDFSIRAGEWRAPRFWNTASGHLSRRTASCSAKRCPRIDFLSCRHPTTAGLPSHSSIVARIPRCTSLTVRTGNIDSVR